MVGCCYWDQSTEGKCRLGFVIGPISPTLSGPAPCFAIDIQVYPEAGEGQPGC